MPILPVLGRFTERQNARQAFFFAGRIIFLSSITREILFARARGDATLCGLGTRSADRIFNVVLLLEYVIMALEVKCSCGEVLHVAEQSAGKRVKCPECGKSVQVPGGGASDWQVRCSCGQTLKAKPEWAGKRIRCPACKDELQVPARASSAFGASTARDAPSSRNTPKGRQRAPESAHDDEETPRPRKEKSFLQRAAKSAHAQYGKEPVLWLYFMTATGIFVTLALPVMLVIAIRMVSLSYSSNHWPTTPCTITVSHIKEERTMRRLRERISYVPHVEFNYIVDNRFLHSDRLSFHLGNYTLEEDAREIVAKYSVGSKHEAYYSPTDPTQAVLIPGGSVSVWFAFLLPAMCLLGPYFLYTYGLAAWYRMQH